MGRKKKDWMKMARAVAESKGWVAWLSTVMMMEEGNPKPVQFFEAAFKVRKEIERCPHCGKAIFRGFDGSDDYVFVSHPRNFIFHSESVDEAWKGLVEEYAKAFGKTSSEVELELAAGGYL